MFLTNHLSWVTDIAHSFNKAIEASRLASAGLIDEAKKTMLEKQKVKSTHKQLSALSDKELADIGITRGDIWAVANGRIDDYKGRV